jgi:hypothetical protein
MAENGQTPAAEQTTSGTGTHTVVAQGEVPFAVLGDGRIITARFRTAVTPQPLSSLSDPGTTQWVLELDGLEFTMTEGEDGRPSWLPIGSAWARGGTSPLSALTDGERHVVRYDYFYAHHLGWLSGPVTLTLDTRSMTVAVDADLRFEAD